jgi:syntaxin 7
MQLKQMNGEIEFNEQMIEEREQEIREIERGIQEINEIFRDMGTIVTEQQSLLGKLLRKRCDCCH